MTNNFCSPFWLLRLVSSPPACLCRYNYKVMKYLLAELRTH